LAEKINDIELDKLLRQGYTTNQLANHFGCSPAAVSQRKRKLQKGIVAVTTLEKADQVVTAHMDMMGQLRRVNGIINDQLDLAVQMLDDLEADRLAIQQNIVKLASEVRRQQETQEERAGAKGRRRAAAALRRNARPPAPGLRPLAAGSPGGAREEARQVT